MKKVLIISPHFPPINAPDHQRVRMALPWLREFGWEPIVLTVKPEFVEGVRDECLTKTLPPDLRVAESDALSVKWTRRLGVGSLAYRAGRYLKRAGDELLRRERFAAVFFSTTVFPTMAFGPKWKKEFGVPYVLDFQDPWLSDYYEEHPGVRPPGGRLKYGFSRRLAQRLEPSAVRGAAHIVSVSPEYPRMLRRRYSELPDDRFTTLPFGAAESDFEALPQLGVKQSLFDPHDGKVHWVYVGRGGADMGFSVRAIFTALRRLLELQPGWRAKLRVHFAGTDYSPRQLARKTIEPIAQECGVGEVVSELTDRLPYFETLRCLRDADALIIPGSDDPSYTASKLYPYILARKPLLAVFHEASSVVEVLEKTQGGMVITFRSGASVEETASKISATGWLPSPGSHLPKTDWTEFEPYTAKAMTSRLCAVFDKAIIPMQREK